MNRKEAREYTMQALFQMEAQRDFEEPDLEKYLSREELGKQKTYVESLLRAVSENIRRVDEIISQCSEGWPPARMSKMDLAIIRVAAGEIIFMEDIPRAVSINEAVELAKKYGTEHSPQFVNAVLGKIQ
ncbi:MAG: transcription antitermination factor NusB [Firmicutes bacterium]|nr:transcription antitermination factor NusB [Bacillota bacterium]MDY5855981.1 transcription antitermination factor NusB [Anaerovoracaceae bacterium]